MEKVKFEFAKLEEKYRNFYSPTFEVLVEGENLRQKGVEISSVSVDHTLSGAAQFTFTINNAFDPSRRELKWLDQLLAIGKQVKIRMGYLDKLELLLVGLLISVRANFPSGGPPQMEVSGYDLSFLMMKGKRDRPPWPPKVKHSEIARKIAADYNFRDVVVEDTRVEHRQVEQGEEESDFQFLSRLARDNKFEFFVLKETFYFRTPARREAPVLALAWGKNLLSFSPELNIAEQVSDLEVRGWNAQGKKEIIGKARAGDEQGKERGGKSGGELVQEIFKEKVIERVRRPVYTQEEADRLAKASFNEHAEKLVTGSGESIGIPEIQVGNNIILDGLGSKFGGKKYYLKNTSHTINSSGYRTTFNVTRNTI